MGELLHLYLGSGEQAASRAFWMGASRLIDSRPVLTKDAALKVAASLGTHDSSEADTWSDVADELHEAIVVTKAK